MQHRWRPPPFYELANDWAFMVPLAEMAVRPAVLPYPLYLYEPSLATWQADTASAFRQRREAVIGEIMARPPYCPVHGATCRNVNSTTSRPQAGISPAAAATAAGTAQAAAWPLPACPLALGRRPLVAVLGDANLEAERVADREEKRRAAFEVGHTGMVQHGRKLLWGCGRACSEELLGGLGVRVGCEWQVRRGPAALLHSAHARAVSLRHAPLSRCCCHMHLVAHV